MHRLVGIFGILFVLGMAFLFSTDRRAIRYKTVAWGLGLQIGLAFLVMRWKYGQLFFNKLGAGAKWLLDFSYYGSSFVFGDLGKGDRPPGFIFAFQALPRSSLSPRFSPCSTISGSCRSSCAMARVMTRLMGASGAESLNVAASIFMGQTEAPLTIRPFLPDADAIRTDDDHDQRHGPRFRRNDGALTSRYGVRSANTCSRR